jgi:disulfide bond formation protein DsbB
MNPQTVVSLLALITLVSNVGFLLILLVTIASKFSKRLKKVTSKHTKLFTSNLLILSFMVSLTATLGSLYFSEVANFEPCKLCWIQRIFMYPLPIILGVAIYKKLNDVWNYVIPLSLVGVLIAAYHYYYQVTGSPLIPCSSVGFSVSCSERFFTHYGYITIPWMSLSAFLYIFFLGFVGKRVS